MEKTNVNRELYKRLIIRLLLAIIYTGLAILIVPRLFKLLHPFIFALIIAAALNPMVSKIHNMVNKLENRSLKDRKIITLILNILILVVVVYLIFVIFYTIAKEVISFSLSIQENWGSILIKFDNLQENFMWVRRILPAQVVGFLDGLKDSFLELVKTTSKNVFSSSISITASIISGTGNFFINFLTFFLAMYFLISDYHIISTIGEKYSDRNIIKTFNIFKTTVIHTLGKFLKAQFILAFFAFVFMFISLRIYGQPHAFIIALFLGLIDLLPILGTIVVLLPWGVIEYIGGDMQTGIFLIGIGIVFLLIRRIIEPKVMGSQIGLHPLFALMSTYVGLRFSGVWGAVLGPLVLMIIISIVKSGILANTMADLRALNEHIASTLNRKAKNDNNENQ